MLISIPDGTPGSYGPPNKKPEQATAAPPAKTPKGKAETKKPTGKPAAKPADSPKAQENKSLNPSADISGPENLAGQIQAQGEKVRALKEAKADKAAIGAEVKTLLELKTSYKAATGKDWQPEVAAKPAALPAVAIADNAGISGKIVAQGDLVRKLKAEKAAKADIDAAVKALLVLKQEYTAATGQEWKPGQQAAAAAAPSPAASSAKAETPVKAKTPPASGNGGGFSTHDLKN